MDKELEKELELLYKAEDYQGIVDLLKGSQTRAALELYLVPSLIELDRYTEAEGVLEQLFDNTGVWWYWKAYAHYGRNEFLDAMEALEKAELLRQKEGKDPIDSPDESLDFRMDELESIILRDQFSVWEAKNEIKKIVDTILAFPEKKRAEWAYWLASAYEDLQDWDKAENVLLTRINQGDDDPWNYIRIGEIIYKQGGRDAEALSYLRQACNMDSEYNEEEYLAKWMSERIRRWHEDKEYQRIIDGVTEFEGNLDWEDSYYIDSLIQLDRKAEAEEAAYALEAEAHWEDDFWCETVIRVRILLDHHTHGVDLAKKAGKLFPDEFKFFDFCIDSLIQLGRKAEAEEAAYSFEAEARWDDDLWYLKVVQTWYELSNFTRAVNSALKVKKLFPEEYVVVSAYHIDSLIQLGRRAEAEEAASALEAKARWDDYTWCLCVAQSWSRLHCPVKVVKIAQKAKKLFPDNSEVFEGYIHCPVGYLTMHESDKVKTDEREIPKDADTVLDVSRDNKRGQNKLIAVRIGRKGG